MPALAQPKTRDADQEKNGEERDRPTTPSGGALHTAGAMGQESMTEYIATARYKVSKLGKPQPKICKKAPLDCHRASDG